MGMFMTINKLVGVKCEDNQELITYTDIYGFEDEVELCYWRKHQWIHKWLDKNMLIKRTKSNDENFMLCKQDIRNLINHCNILLKEGYDKYYSKHDFFITQYYSDGIHLNNKISEEINSAIKQLIPLLKEDFKNNTIYYHYDD